MLFDKKTKVNNTIVKLVPYTEKRRALLEAVNANIRAYVEANPGLTFEDMPVTKKAEFWKQKADILWEAEKPLDLDFFEDENFEFPILKDTEDFFFMMRLYL
jgi:hypothetical protein